MSVQAYPLPEDQKVLNLRIERGLLVLAFLFIAVNMAALALTRGGITAEIWLPLLIWVACAIVGHLVLEYGLPRHDPMLFPLTMFLSGWGLVLIDRLAPNFGERQAIWLILSTVALVFTALVPMVLRWLRNFRYTLLVIGLILLVATIVLGKNPSGQAGAPELWLGFGSIYFQPSEALKIILAAFLASYLGEQYPALRAEGLDAEDRWLSFSPRIFGPILLMWGLSVIILVWQRDLGTAILFFMVFLVLLYVASNQPLILAGGGLLILVAGVVAYFAFDVVRLRVDVWLNPWPEADGRAYQIVQSLLAFAAGGVFGQGIGQGSPTFIPVIHSDFVFAALAEEWGLHGVMTIIACISIIVMRGLRIAILQGARPFNTLLAVGLSTLIAVQSLLIMAGVLKLAPLTGVTLPFLSYGGSSLLMNFVIIGLLLRLSALEREAIAVHTRN